MILPCDCPSPAHCLEATGGEQGLTADELEIVRLRRERIEQEATNLEMGGEIAKLRRELSEARADISALRDDRDRIRTASAEALESRDRLSTIVDEAFGAQEVLDTDALLSRLEHLLTEMAHERLLVLAERDEARARISALEKVAMDCASQCDHCEPAIRIERLSEALRDLIASVEATKTRIRVIDDTACVAQSAVMSGCRQTSPDSIPKTWEPRPARCGNIA